MGQPREPRRTAGRRLLRWVALLAPWVLATLAGLTAAASTRIGPEVAQLSENHGVHLGDVLALAVAYAAAAAVTVAVLRAERRRRARAEARRRPGRAAPRSGSRAGRS